MKKYIIASLLVCIPFISMAADHCTNPSEYTIDKRCYVTNDQKKQKPYNAVVGLISTYGGWLRNKLNKSTFCTGTIARWDRGFVHKEAPDSNWYLFTAKHCTDQNGDGISDRNLRIKLQDGDEYDVTLVTAGNYDINKDSNVSEDWAIYSLPVNPFKESTDPYVENVYRNMVQYHGREVSTPNDKIPWIYADSNATRDNRPVRLIGYGSLKIMNDNEIEEFNEKYIAALEKAG
ncbi:MAG: hypothetical protein IKZ64_00735, partial [Alphaproteobacteria bacterium]|nr:hypothetical protein [Alphaproteobacteria bacterium]